MASEGREAMGDGFWRSAWASAALTIALSLPPLRGAVAAPPVEAPLTSSEAQALPLAQLAHRVLGAAGDIVREIDRPDWGPCPQRFGRCLTPHWPPPGPPPLKFTLYSRATSTDRIGLCTAQRIHVAFDDNGRAAQLNAETRYGAETPLSAAFTPDDIAASERICAAARSTRNYFPAPNARIAYRAALFTAQIRDAAATGAAAGPSPAWTLTCRFQGRQPCREGLANVIAAKLEAARIETVLTEPCPVGAQFHRDCDAITYRFDLPYAVVHTVSAWSQHGLPTLVSVDIDWEVPSP